MSAEKTDVLASAAMAATAIARFCTVSPPKTWDHYNAAIGPCGCSTATVNIDLPTAMFSGQEGAARSAHGKLGASPNAPSTICLTRGGPSKTPRSPTHLSRTARRAISFRGAELSPNARSNAEVNREEKHLEKRRHQSRLPAGKSLP